MGVVKSITENMAEIRFDDAMRTIAPETSDLEAAEARASVTGLDMPLTQFIEKRRGRCSRTRSGETRGDR